MDSKNCMIRALSRVNDGRPSQGIQAFYEQQQPSGALVRSTFFVVTLAVCGYVLYQYLFLSL